jgi:cbb3-type cytochrome oxidase subunit 3
MSPETAYFLYGLTLCTALAGIIAFYFARKRKHAVEDAKYRMLEDDDDTR